MQNLKYIEHEQIHSQEIVRLEHYQAHFKNKITINEQIIKTERYLDKMAVFAIYNLTPNGKNIMGFINIDVSKIFNTGSWNQRTQYKLDQCPDKQAKVTLGISVKAVSESYLQTNNSIVFGNRRSLSVKSSQSLSFRTPMRHSVILNNFSQYKKPGSITQSVIISKNDHNISLLKTQLDQKNRKISRLEIEKNSYIQQIENLRNNLVSIKTKFQLQNINLEEFKNNNKQLKQKYQQLQKSYKVLTSKSVSESNKQNKSAQVQLKILRCNKQQLQKTITSLKRMHRESIQTKSNLQSQLTATKKKLQIKECFYQQQLKNSTQKLVKIEDEIMKIRRQIQITKQQRVTTDKSYLKQKQRLLIERQKLDKQNITTKQQLKKTQEELSGIKNKAKSNQIMNQQLQKLKLELSNTKLQQNKLNQKLRKKQQQLSQLSASLKQKTDIILHNQSTIQESHITINKLQNLLQEATRRADLLSSTLSNSRTIEQQNETQIVSLREQIQLLKQNLMSSDQNRNKINSQVQYYRNYLISQQQKNRNHLSEVVNKNRILQEQVLTLQHKLTQIENEYQQKYNTISILYEQTKEKQKQYANEQEQRNKRIEEALMKEAKANEQNLYLRSQLQRIKQMQILIFMKDKLLNENNERIVLLQLQKQKLNLNVVQYQQQICTLNNQFIQREQRERDQLNVQIRKLEDQKIEYCNRIKQLQMQIKQSGDKLVKQVQNNKSLTNTNINNQNKIRIYQQQIIKQKDQIDTLNKYIQDINRQTKVLNDQLSQKQMILIELNSEVIIQKDKTKQMSNRNQALVEQINKLKDTNQLLELKHQQHKFQLSSLKQQCEDALGREGVLNGIMKEYEHKLEVSVVKVNHNQIIEIQKLSNQNKGLTIELQNYKIITNVEINRLYQMISCLNSELESKPKVEQQLKQQLHSMQKRYEMTISEMMEQKITLEKTINELKNSLNKQTTRCSESKFEQLRKQLIEINTAKSISLSETLIPQEISKIVIQL